VDFPAGSPGSAQYGIYGTSFGSIAPGGSIKLADTGQANVEIIRRSLGVYDNFSLLCGGRRHLIDLGPGLGHTGAGRDDPGRRDIFLVVPITLLSVL